MDLGRLFIAHSRIILPFSIFSTCYSNGTQSMSIIFSKADKRTQWEQVFNEAKQKLGWTFHDSISCSCFLNKFCLQFRHWKNILYLNSYPVYQFVRPELVFNSLVLLQHWAIKKMSGFAIATAMWVKFVFSVYFPNQQWYPVMVYAMLEYYA